MLFAGCLNRNALHSHSAPVLLAGIYDTFQFRLGNSSWFSCRTAVVRAGTAYEFDAGGRPLAVIYVEPNDGSVNTLASLINEAYDLPGASIGMRCELSLIRALYEDAESMRWAAAALEDLITFSKARSRRTIDARIARAVAALSVDEDIEDEDGRILRPSIATAAQAAGLSRSRFQHLFKDEVGVPYRRYGAWARMRLALREIVGGSNFTTAAHAAGFCDQAHFANAFRRTFGAPPRGAFSMSDAEVSSAAYNTRLLPRKTSVAA